MDEDDEIQEPNEPEAENFVDHTQQQRSQPSTSSRDPRLKKKSFLEGGLSVKDLIRSSDPVPSRNLSDFQNQAKAKVDNALDLLNSRQNTFYANIPKNPRIADDFEPNRSPLAVTRSSVLMCQATAGNAADAMGGMRYRNIPRSTQEVANRLGADLDGISQSMKRPVVVESSYENMVTEDRVGDHQNEPEKTFADKEVQTVKNHGGFSHTIDDLSTLTEQQRAALTAFKKVSRRSFALNFPLSFFEFLQAMNIEDEATTSGILERLQHRRASKIYQSSRDENGNHKSNPSTSYSSRDDNHSPTAGPSRYFTNATPK